MECPICVENTSEKRTISCPSCNAKTCFNCIEEHIKNIKGDEIKCIFCKNVWTPLFLQKTFPMYMIFGKGVVRKHTEKNVFEREKALLPETQLHIARSKHRRALISEMRTLQERIMNIKKELYSRPINNQDTTKPMLVCGCPTDNCRGFIMRPKYTCGICDVKICKSCHKVTNDHHTCDENDVESVKFLKKDSKPCPSCSAPSKKTEGCTQVWCLVCKKAWNWNTCQIETGYVHATDYFNYMRAQGLAIPARPDNPQEVRCDNHYRIRWVPNTLSRVLKAFPDMGQELNHVQKIYQVYCENNYMGWTNPGNNDLRIKYLQGELDETKWKALLLRREKEALMKQEIQNMRNSFRTVLSDLFVDFEAAKMDDVNTIIKTIIGFHNIILHEYAILAKSFHSKRACPFSIK